MAGRSSHSPSLAGMEDSDRFLALIAEFQTTDDTARIQEIYAELLLYDNGNVLDLPLIYTKDMVVYNSEKVAGYTFTSTPMFFDVRNVQPVQ